MTPPNDALRFLPSGYYWRKAIRESNWIEVKQLALALVDEVEQLRQWAITQGMTPPQFNATVEEVQAKGLEAAEETA